MWWWKCERSQGKKVGGAAAAAERQRWRKKVGQGDEEQESREKEETRRGRSGIGVVCSGWTGEEDCEWPVGGKSVLKRRGEDASLSPS